MTGWRGARIVDLIIHYAPDRQPWLRKLSTSRSIRSMLRPRWQSCVGRAPLRGEAVAPSTWRASPRLREQIGVSSRVG